MSQLLLNEIAAPGTPVAAKVTVYAKSDGLVYGKDDAGVETSMSGGSASGVKAWGKADAAGAVSASYNLTSVTDTGTGVITWNIATDFSSANYAVVAGFQATTFNGSLRISAQAAGSLGVTVTDFAGIATDPIAHFFNAEGAQ